MESISERKFRKKILKEDEKKSHWRFGIPIIIFMALVPHFASEYITGILVGLMIMVIVAVGLNLLMGYTGQFSLGHAAFVAIGAYGTAFATVEWGFPFTFAMLFGAILAAVISLTIGIPALRIEGLYLAIATMGFAFIIDEVIYQWESVTGGASGFSVPPAEIFGITFDTDFSFYYLALFITVALVIMAKNIAVSSIGRAFIAVRNSEEAAQAHGISIVKAKTLAFVLSAFYAGIAGGLSAFYLMFISAENFTLATSIEYVVMVVVGGMSSIYGAVIGAVIIGFLPHLVVMIRDFIPPLLEEVLPGLPGFTNGVGIVLDNPDFRYLIYGAIMLFFIVYEPTGIYGIWLRIKFYWKTFPFNRKKVRFKGKRMLLYRSYR